MSNDTKPDLFAEIQKAESVKNTGGTPCTINSIIESMDEDDAEALSKAFADPSIKGTTICKVLKARGFAVASHTVQRHRRGGCSCDPLPADEGVASE